MTVHLAMEVEKLKKRLLQLGALVEERLREAVAAFQNRDEAAAARVVAGDIEVDRMEVDLEEDCLKVLALHQPVASDLRLIVSILKINNDLERIGDLAVNIAERAEIAARREACPIPFDLDRMAEDARTMLKKSLDALVRRDAALANEVCRDDDEVDEINRGGYDRVMREIREHPDRTEMLLYSLSVARQLERIADHATNIAEDVIYMLQGKIVRHGQGTPPAPDAKPAG